jgi:hypothetical protein
MQTILEESIRDYNLDLFLARHHPQLMQLATHRHIQANMPARALPILELLAECVPNQDLAVIELGCAAGNLGLALLNAKQICSQTERYFPNGQQLPKVLPNIACYRGYDLDLPEPTWVLACVSSRPERERLAVFMADLAPTISSKNFQIQRADALHFPKLPGLDIEPTQRPIILTSFMCYQLPDTVRPTLEQAIMNYTLEKGGHWLDVDLVPRAKGGLEFVLRMDGQARIVLHDDYCITWSWLEARSR